MILALYGFFCLNTVSVRGGRIRMETRLEDAVAEGRELNACLQGDGLQGHVVCHEAVVSFEEVGVGVTEAVEFVAGVCEVLSVSEE